MKDHTINTTTINSTRKVYFIDCPKCGKRINGTSKKMLKHNIKIHNIFCKGVKNEKNN